MSTIATMVTLLPVLWAAVPEVEAREKLIAVMALRTQDVDATTAQLISGALREEMEHAFRGSPFGVMEAELLAASAAEMPACQPGACDLEIARRSAALVFLSGELVLQDGTYFLGLRLFECEQGARLASAQVSGTSPADVRKEMRGAVEGLAKELVELDAEAEKIASEIVPSSRDPDPVTETVMPKRPPQVPKAAPAGESASTEEPAWKAPVTVAAVVVPVVLVSYAVLFPLMLLPPVLKELAMLVWGVHAVVAAGIAWLVSGRVLEKRAPMLPLLAAGGAAEAAAFLACGGPLWVLTAPTRLLLAPPLIAALSAANIAAVVFTLSRTGRPLVPEEGTGHVDMVTVPPPPAPRHREEELDLDAPVRVVPTPAPEPPARRAYRLQPREQRREILDDGSPEPASDHPAMAPIPADEDEDEEAGEGGTRAPVTGGLADDAMGKVIRGSMPAFNACYENGLKRNSKMKGRMVVAFTIEENGRVGEVKVESTELNDAEVNRCVVQRFKRLQFPAPEGGGR